MAAFESNQSGVENDFTQDHSDDLTPITFSNARDLCKGVFTVQISDTSMECDDERRSIPKGAHIRMDAGQTPSIGDVVIAEVPGERRLLLRELAQDGDSLILAARNLDYPPVEIDSAACVIARATKVHIYVDV